MGAKEGFRKNVEPNNPHYDKDGEVMAKWTMSIYWGTDRADLTVKQIKSIVPKAKGSKKKDVQRSAMQVATYAQIKALHKRLGFRENKNTQAVRANIARLWFAAQ